MNLRGLLIKFLNNKKGFSLIEVMIAAAALGGLTLVVMQISKQTVESQVRSKVDADVMQLKTEIQSILNNPAHCNANTYGNTTNAVAVTITGINECSSTTLPNSCASATNGTRTNLITKFSPSGTYTDRVRVTSVKRLATPTAVPSDVDNVLTNVTWEFTIEKKLMGTAQNPSPVKSEILNFSSTAVVNTAGSLTGCPRTWNTTIVY